MEIEVNQIIKLQIDDNKDPKKDNNGNIMDKKGQQVTAVHGTLQEEANTLKKALSNVYAQIPKQK